MRNIDDTFLFTRRRFTRSGMAATAAELAFSSLAARAAEVVDDTPGKDPRGGIVRGEHRGSNPKRLIDLTPGGATFPFAENHIVLGPGDIDVIDATYPGTTDRLPHRGASACATAGVRLLKQMIRAGLAPEILRKRAPHRMPPYEQARGACRRATMNPTSIESYERASAREDFSSSSRDEKLERHPLWVADDIDEPESWTLASFTDLLPHELT